jgi:hypothetical protein
VSLLQLSELVCFLHGKGLWFQYAAEKSYDELQRMTGQDRGAVLLESNADPHHNSTSISHGGILIIDY